MSQPRPSQPIQLQYPISTLDLFQFNATRAAYRQATAQQAPPFDASQPLKGCADPAPNGQPYLVFDSTAGATGYVSQMTLGSQAFLAHALIETQRGHGVGAPGQWTLTSGTLDCVYDPPVTAASANAVTDPVKGH
jgi:hypothetical protein